jgi:hypothetical protein
MHHGLTTGPDIDTQCSYYGSHRDQRYCDQVTDIPSAKPVRQVTGSLPGTGKEGGRGWPEQGDGSRASARRGCGRDAGEEAGGASAQRVRVIDGRTAGNRKRGEGRNQGARTVDGKHWQRRMRRPGRWLAGRVFIPDDQER